MTGFWDQALHPEDGMTNPKRRDEMKIEDLTIGEPREVVTMLSGGASGDGHWQVGKNYLIRTVTMIQSGRLVAVTEKELVLEDAAWIADTGRFSKALEDLDALNEVEPFPEGQVIIGRGALIDAVQIPWAARTQK